MNIIVLLCIMYLQYDGIISSNTTYTRYYMRHERKNRGIGIGIMQNVYFFNLQTDIPYVINYLSNVPKNNNNAPILLVDRPG